MRYNLIVDNSFDNKDFDIITESAQDGKKTYWVKGPYMAANSVNRNKRKYMLEEMASEAERYTKEFITQNRALGELNHPQSAEIDLGRACHMITELKQEGNIWLGKSKILSTPCGEIVASMLRDGVKLGMSTRALGTLTPETDDTNVVSNLKLITVDCVADPSCHDAFVNGILENRSFIIGTDNKFEQLYERFDARLKNLPKADLDKHLRETLLGFVARLK